MYLLAIGVAKWRRAVVRLLSLLLRIRRESRFLASLKTSLKEADTGLVREAADGCDSNLSPVATR